MSVDAFEHAVVLNYNERGEVIDPQQGALR